MRRSLLTHVLVLTTVVLATVGCRSMTGQSLGSNIDDAKTTAAVKAKLVADHPKDITRVDVDTVNGTVYLKGVVDRAPVKQRATEIAQSVTGVKKVVNNIEVRPPASASSGASSAAGTSSAMASPATTTAMQNHQGVHTITGTVTGLDANRGQVWLHTEHGPLTLPFPADSLKSIRVGDQVTVEMGLRSAR